MKNILNGRLKSGSVNEIDWENEPLPKDIFTDKNKEQKSKDINKSRDTLFDPNKVNVYFFSEIFFSFDKIGEKRGDKFRHLRHGPAKNDQIGEEKEKSRRTG